MVNESDLNASSYGAPSSPPSAAPAPQAAPAGEVAPAPFPTSWKDLIAYLGGDVARLDQVIARMSERAPDLAHALDAIRNEVNQITDLVVWENLKTNLAAELAAFYLSKGKSKPEDSASFHA